MAANSGSLPKFLERPTSYTTGVWGGITTVDHKKNRNNVWLYCYIFLSFRWA